ncbi:MAG TPA: hypothetical protein VGI39_03585 [Polyangiaceae bacterium]|jgi:hypothetical protein
MGARTSVRGVVVLSPFLVLAGCITSDNGGAPDGGGVVPIVEGGGADFDAGGSGDATTGGGGDSGTGGGLDAGGGSDSGGGTDGGGAEGSAGEAGGDEGGTVFANCDPKTAVDLTGGVNGAQGINAIAAGDKQVALWMLAFQVSPDNQNHWNARGAGAGSWGSVVDLGVGNFYPSPFLVSDGAGRGFAQYTTGTATVRSLYDFGTQAFAAATPFGGSAGTGGGTDSALVGLLAGGAVSMYTSYAAAGALVADKWSPGSGQWEATPLNVVGTPNQLNVQVNPTSGRLGYVYYDYNGSLLVLHVGAYDGTSWVTDAVTLPQEAGVPGNFTVGTYTNGDLLVAYYSSADGALVAARYHVTGKTWDAPVVLDPGGGFVGSVHVAVDGADRATVVWQRGTANGFARRNLGSSWAPATDLGPAGGGASGYRLALDASSNAYILTSDPTSSNLVLWRAAATSDAFAAPYSTGLATTVGALSSNTNLDRGSALAFDGAGHPLVYAALLPAAKDGGVGLSLYMTTCR